MRAKYQHILAEFPGHPRSLEVLDLLLEAAEAGGIGSHEQPAREALMAQFADDNVGLYLFDLSYDDLSGESVENAIGYCRKVQESLAGTAVAAMALDRELEVLADTDSSEFLARCEALSGHGNPVRLQKVALLRRAEFSHSSGRSKEACLDYFRLWTISPDLVGDRRVRSSAAAALQASGFVLERDIAGSSSSSVPPRFWPFLLEHFEQVAVSPPVPENSEHPSIYSAAYFHQAPDLDAIQSSAPPSVAISFDQALSQLRLGRLAVDRREFVRAVGIYDASIDSAQQLLEIGDLGQVELEALSVYNEAAITNLKAIFGGSELVRNLLRRQGVSDPASLGRSTITGLVAIQEKILLRLVESAAQEDDQHCAEATDRLTAFYASQNNRKGVIDAYSAFVERFSESPLAPDYMMKMADFYKDEWNAPSMSGEILGQLIERYPESPHVPNARLKSGLYFYQSGRFAEALIAFQEFLANVEDQNREMIATAHFLSALCEASLELDGESERHMEEVAARYAETPLAPRALFWLGSQFLARQDYSKARRRFADLVERYPNSREAVQAGQYVERLAQLQEETQRE